MIRERPTTRRLKELGVDSSNRLSRIAGDSDVDSQR